MPPLVSLRSALALVAALLIVVASPALAQETIVTFNDEIVGVAIAPMAYETSGVLISNAGGSFEGYACTECDLFGFPSVSGASYAVLLGGAVVMATFIDPTSGENTQASNVSLFLANFAQFASVQTFLADGSPGPSCANVFAPTCPYSTPNPATGAQVDVLFPGPVASLVLSDNGTGVVIDDLAFELAPNAAVDPDTKKDCKKGGWEAFGFRNQGQCVRFVNSGKDSR